MNNSVGIDIVEFARIEKMISERFINRILSDEEKVIYDNFKSDKRRIEFLAGRFAQIPHTDHTIAQRNNLSTTLARFKRFGANSWAPPC
mgnify:CR=1 FL=1